MVTKKGSFFTQVDHDVNGLDDRRHDDEPDDDPFQLHRVAVFVLLLEHQGIRKLKVHLEKTSHECLQTSSSPH